MQKMNIDNISSTTVNGLKPIQKTQKDQGATEATFQMALKTSVNNHSLFDDVVSNSENRNETIIPQQLLTLTQVEQLSKTNMGESNSKKINVQTKQDGSLLSKSGALLLPESNFEKHSSTKQIYPLHKHEPSPTIDLATDAEMLKYSEQANALSTGKPVDTKNDLTSNILNPFNLDKSFEATELLSKESVIHKPEIKTVSNIDLKSIDLSRLISDLKNMISKESEKVEVGDKKELKITVRPSVLGEIKIEMAKSHDGIKMLIVASNDNVSNLLSQYRDEIVDVAERGMSSGGNGQPENDSNHDRESQSKRYTQDESQEDLITPELTITQHFTY